MQLTNTKLKSGTAYLLNGTPVFIEHDKGNGTATIRYCPSKLDAKKVDIVRVEDLKPVVKERIPIAKASDSRAKENREYLVKRKEFLTVNTYCEANVVGCTRIANQVHHSAGRVGKRLVDVELFVALCPSCHSWCEKNPEMAKEMGLSVNRI
jgi:hypothetical protein